MFKKLAAFTIVFAMAAAMWIVPSHASTLTDALFFDADYSTGSFDSKVGNIHGKEYTPDPETQSEIKKVEFIEDAEINRKVLSFYGDSAVFYDDFDYVKFQNNFTFEVYVKLPAKDAAPSGWGYIAGTYWNVNPDCGIAFTYGRHSIAGVGTNRKFNVLQGNGKNSNPNEGGESYTTFTGNKADGNWKHLVYTHDGTTEAYYEDGVLIASQDATQSSIPSAAGDDLRGFRIGAYNKIAQFSTVMDCAYVRVYAAAASADEVTELYNNRNSDAPKPANVATTAPSATNAPSATTTTSSSSTKTDNASTFDLGIVSLAAVALSSAVAVKKRKR